MIKAIIFDYDGVLFDSVAVGFEAYRNITDYLKLNRIRTMEEFRSAQRHGYKMLLDDWGIADQKVREQTKAIYLKKNEQLKEKIRLIPGIKRILEELSRKHTLAVASGTYNELIQERLKTLGISHYFSVIIGNRDVANNKPSPDIINLALEKLKIKPHEAVYVGDMVFDVIAGKAANVKTIAIANEFSWNKREHLEEQQPDVIINKHEELLNAVDDI